MQRVLLVEPNYKNKYPPIGLMKIATYHRKKGDIVEFYKGEAPYTKVIQADRVYITTLFTFYYEITVNTIKHYLKYKNKDSVFLGGIAATLLARDFRNDTGLDNIIQGQLYNSSLIGYRDNINIDSQPLDYDILDDITYDYPAGDNYFVYTTRGCPRGCDFCAVRILEPEFKTTNNIISQVEHINKLYGLKRNLLIMDNNILCSKKLEEIIDDIIKLGFTGEPNFTYPNKFRIMMDKINRRVDFSVDSTRQVYQTLELIYSFKKRIEKYPRIKNEIDEKFKAIKESDDIVTSLNENSNYLEDFFSKYSSKTKMIRYVDFNQGIDARLINDRTINQLARIPIKPFRLAYDSIEETKVYKESIQMAIDHGVKYFSNYMLYNWEDKPEDLWLRLNIATDLYAKNKEVQGFSFPMKYSPINEKDRSFIGNEWNRKYLNAVNVIINVTNGVVAKEKDFFYKAFGKSIDEYYEILSMPEEFIRYRFFFEENGLIDIWTSLFRELSNNDKEILIKHLSESLDDKMNYCLSNELKRILVLYKVKKAQLIKQEISIDSIKQELEVG